MSIKRLFGLISPLLVAACGEQPYDTSKYIEAAMQAPYFTEQNQSINGRTINGVVAGEKCKPAVLLIHGAPGDWQSWARYFTDPDLTNQTRLIALDRPGYGGSEKGRWEPSLKTQAELLLKAAQTYTNNPFIVVGHSYGGPVALQMAIDAPKAVSSLVLLAGSVDPKLEKVTWYQTAATWKLLNWLVPEPLDVANKEILPLKAELETQALKLNTISTPTVVIQGDKDKLVPKENADFLKTNLSNAPMEMMRLPEQGHFLPWLEYDLVKAEILKAASAHQGCAS